MSRDSSGLNSGLPTVSQIVLQNLKQESLLILKYLLKVVSFGKFLPTTSLNIRRVWSFNVLGAHCCLFSSCSSALRSRSEGPPSLISSFIVTRKVMKSSKSPSENSPKSASHWTSFVCLFLRVVLNGTVALRCRSDYNQNKLCLTSSFHNESTVLPNGKSVHQNKLWHGTWEVLGATDAIILLFSTEWHWLHS